MIHRDLPRSHLRRICLFRLRRVLTSSSKSFLHGMPLTDMSCASRAISRSYSKRRPRWIPMENPKVCSQKRLVRAATQTRCHSSQTCYTVHMYVHIYIYICIYIYIFIHMSFGLMNSSATVLDEAGFLRGESVVGHH